MQKTPPLRLGAKGKHANLDAAFGQLRRYVPAPEDPPLLIVADMLRFRIHTNWTNCVSETDAANRNKLKWAFSDPERLRPGETRQSLTEQAAESFATVAQSLRARGHNPHAVAHFVNRLVSCMFADDVGLLPGHMFTQTLEQARRVPDRFTELAGARQGGASRTRRDQLQTRRREPEGTASGDQDAADLRGMEQRAVGD